MPSFCSFLIFKPDEIDLVHAICAEAGWSTGDLLDPSKRFRFTASGMSELNQAPALPDSVGLRDDEEYGKLLVLETEENEANNVIELIRAANLVLEGFPDRFNLAGPGFEIPDDADEREIIFQSVFRTEGFFERFTYRHTLVTAVAVAARAWSDSSIIYAIHKLARSYMTESVSPHSMHPSYGQVFEKHTGNFSSHVGTSIAINLAYSAIQELGLDIKSNSQKPRWLDNKEYVWNPTVVENVKSRLKDSGIDPDRRIDWVVRGARSEVEVHPVRETFASHSDGQTIRDRELSLPDAINSCEYLRNFMTAHAFSGSTPLLGPYEVYNIQSIARLLALSKCGLWNVWTDELRERYGQVR